MHPLREILPAVALAAALGANGVAAPAPQEPETTGEAARQAVPEKLELRPADDAAPSAKRAIRVILPSPYSERQ